MRRVTCVSLLALLTFLPDVYASSKGTAAHPVSQPRVVMGQGKRQTTIRVELACSNAQRMKGLMFRRSMKDDRGMLFVFPYAAIQSFWMKNTYIPLDMIHLDKSGVVVGIIENAKPHNLVSLQVGRPAMYVLEVNAFVARRLGVKVGHRVKLLDTSCTPNRPKAKPVRRAAARRPVTKRVKKLRPTSKPAPLAWYAVADDHIEVIALFKEMKKSLPVGVISRLLSYRRPAGNKHPLGYDRFFSTRSKLELLRWVMRWNRKLHRKFAARQLKRSYVLRIAPYKVSGEQYWRTLLLKKKAILQTQHVAKASIAIAPVSRMPELHLTTTAIGKRIISAHSRTHLGHRMALLRGLSILQVMVIDKPLGSALRILFDHMSRKAAMRRAKQIRAHFRP